jgi:acyl carrier protein
MEKTEINKKLRDFILTEIVRNPSYPLEENEPLITGGLIDSHSLVRIAVFIEDNLGVYLPDTDLTVEKMDTLSAMTQRIFEEMP